jgi:serine protease Do
MSVVGTNRRLAAAAAGFLLTAALVEAQQAARPNPAAGARSSDLSALLEAAAQRTHPAVVRIFATGYVANEGLLPATADLVATARSSGSGVLVDPSGYIVTNAHVVRGASLLRVEVPVTVRGTSILPSAGRLFGGQLVGLDIETDLAVIKIDGKGLPALTFGDSDEIRSGQIVLAVGSPLGFENSVSLGVVSSVARQLEPESPMVYLQTDAAINPGSSGGPLVDLQGRLIGINTLIASRSGGSQGIGFAAPSNIVRTVYDQIKATGKVRRGDLGVRAQTIGPALAVGLKLVRESGVILSDVVPGGPAARAGLMSGDIVTALDGKAMENARQFHVGVYRRGVGQPVAIDILRDGVAQRRTVTVVARPDDADRLTSLADPRANRIARLGVLAVTLDAPVAALLPPTRNRAGVVVASTVAGAIDSADGGLAPGDVIYAVNRTPVATVPDLRGLVDALRPGDAVVLHLERQGALRYLAFTVD